MSSRGSFWLYLLPFFLFWLWIACDFSQALVPERKVKTKMKLRGFPDFVQYNDQRKAQGFSTVGWQEFQRIRRLEMERDKGRCLIIGPHEATGGKAIVLLPQQPGGENARPVASEASSGQPLVLTSEMEVLDLEPLEAPSLATDIT